MTWRYVPVWPPLAHTLYLDIHLFQSNHQSVYTFIDFDFVVSMSMCWYMYHCCSGDWSYNKTNKISPKIKTKHQKLEISWILWSKNLSISQKLDVRHHVQQHIHLSNSRIDMSTIFSQTVNKQYKLILIRLQIDVLHITNVILSAIMFSLRWFVRITMLCITNSPNSPRYI